MALLPVGATAAHAAGASSPDLRLEASRPWRSAGNGATDTHSAPDESLLGKDTLPYLSEKWVFTADGEVHDTPTVEDNALYVSDAGGSIWRLNASTGGVVWQARLPSITGNPSSYARVSPAIAASVVIIGDQASGTVLALSKSSGALVWQTTLATYKEAIITSSPVVVGGRVYVGTSSNSEIAASKTPGFVPDFRGSFAALEVNTGKVLWQTHTVPPGYTGGAVWSSNIAVDPSRSAIYVTTGNNYSVPDAVASCQASATTPAGQDACLPSEDHIDSVLSVDMNTGAINWAQRFTHADTWTTSCEPRNQPPATPCPVPTGLDTDFASGANLFTINYKGGHTAVVGAGQKSGAYFTMNRDTGEILWGTQVGPGGGRGGVLWGTATDGKRIYVPEANGNFVETTLVPSGQKTNGGFWSALDPSTGQILWQTPTFSPQPAGATKFTVIPPPGALADAEGSVSVANGVMYGEDSAGHFLALDAATGRVLRSFQSGSAGVAGPAIVDGTLYWGSGYAGIGGPTDNKLYAFWLGVQ